MTYVAARQKFALLCATLLVFSSVHAWADEIEVKVRAHVKLERLHPDVEKVKFWCDYFDKQGKSLKANAGLCDMFDETTVGSDRKVDGAMSWCLKFDESFALKQSWDKYKCNVILFHKELNGGEVPSPNHAKKWARVKPGAVIYSEGQFKMD